MTAAAVLVGGAYAVHVPGIAFGNSPATYHAMLDEYCFRCHSGTTPRGDVDLRVLNLADFKDRGAVWEKLLRKLRNHEMPPPGRWKPSTAMIDSFVNYIDDGRDHLADVDPSPGRPTIHRLNRTEYHNVVRDLLAVDVDVSDLLPADDIGYGFDNIGDALNMSPLLLQRYLTAAHEIADQAIGDLNEPASYQTYDVPHDTVQTSRMSADMPAGSRGGLLIKRHFPVDADYEISVTVQRGRFGEVLGNDQDHKIALLLDGKQAKQFDLLPRTQRDRVITQSGKYVLALRAHAYQGGGDFGSGYEPDADFKVRIPVKAGTHTVIATFVKDTTVPGPSDFTDFTSALQDSYSTFFAGIGTVNIAGPFNVTGVGDTTSRRKIFLCHPKSTADERPCAEKIVSNLLHRAYRRPVQEADLHETMAYYKQGAEEGGFEAGIKLALEKILVSPEFLFRVEFDPPNAAPGSIYHVSDVALASRLSFFLWSTTPDDELLSVAERGKLHEPAVLDQQVHRMLADPRARSLVTNFAGQWLYLRNIARLSPDPSTFPDFDENLRQSMLTETQMLIESTLREDQPVFNLLKTDYTYVNQRMAEHYGINGIYGPQFHRVKLTDPNRFGLLGQASILTVTSYPNRTAPTIRGKWVLEQLLDSGPPPPPPNVPALKDDATTNKLSMRKRMEQHRADPVCAACHRLMDPIGFALENYDGVGHWRTNYGPTSGPIDPTGTMPDGTPFSGPTGLRKILLGKKEEFVEAFTKQLLTYALGRGVEEYDMPAIRKIVRAAAPHDYRWSSIILGIVHSTPFEMRKVADPSVIRQADNATPNNEERLQ